MFIIFLTATSNIISNNDLELKIKSENILSLLKKNKKMSISELRKVSHFKKRDLSEIISYLKNENKIMMSNHNMIFYIELNKPENMY